MRPIETVAADQCRHFLEHQQKLQFASMSSPILFAPAVIVLLAGDNIEKICSAARRVVGSWSLSLADVNGLDRLATRGVTLIWKTLA